MEHLDNLEKFLETNKFTHETWKKANIEWGKLTNIAKDHLSRIEELEESAIFFAKLIQKIPAVHSVRWRIKDPQHLIANDCKKAF